MPKNKIDEVTLRTLRYWSVDGLAEIGFGSFMLLVSVFLLTVILIPHHPGNNLLILVLFICIIGLGGLGLNKIFHQVKERMTYPRTGYIAYGKTAASILSSSRKNNIARLIIFLVFILTLAGSLYGSMLNMLSPAANLIFFSIILASPLYLLGITYYIRRFYMIGALEAVFGLVISRFVWSESIGMVILFGCLSLMTLSSGTISLINYRRTHRLPDDSGQDG